MLRQERFASMTVALFLQSLNGFLGHVGTSKDWSDALSVLPKYELVFIKSLSALHVRLFDRKGVGESVLLHDELGALSPNLQTYSS